MLPHIDPASLETGLALNGSMLVPDLQGNFIPNIHGTKAIDILYSGESPLNRIHGFWELKDTCLYLVQVQDDCPEEDRTKTLILDMHNQQKALAGLTMTYMLGDHPRIIRFSPFADLTAFYDQKNSRHWMSPLLAAIAPGLGMAAANVVFSDTISMHTNMHFTPTPILSSVPLATNTATSTTISTTTSAPTTRSTSRTAPSRQTVSSTPSVSLPETPSTFQHPLGRTFQKVLAYIKSLDPCKSLRESTPRKLSDLRLPKHVQIGLAASRPNTVDSFPNPPSPPTPPPNAIPTSGSNFKAALNASQHHRALKWTAIVFILVCIGAVIFSELIGDPRRRVDRAASREERRNRRLYRHAARKEYWRQVWARVGQKIMGRLDRRFGRSIWMERWRRRGSNAIESGLYHVSGIRGGEYPLDRSSFDEKGFRIDPSGAEVPAQAGPSDLANEIYDLRYTYAVVDRMVRAEEGHAGDRTATHAPFRTKATWNRVPRVVHHARRWSSASNKTGSDITAPPPYSEGEDPSLIDVDIRSEGTGKSVNTDDTPDSSVVGTSPRASLFARERDRDSSGCGSDSE